MPRSRDPEATLARRAKRAGMTKEFFVNTRRAVFERVAHRDGWRPSELAATLADVTMAADKVFGPSKAEG